MKKVITRATPGRSLVSDKMAEGWMAEGRMVKEIAHIHTRARFDCIPLRFEY